MIDDPETAARVARIAQALILVCWQTGYPIDDALEIMFDRAVISGRTLDEIVDATIQRTLSFTE